MSEVMAILAGPVQFLPLLAAWLLAMISVPLLAMRGDRGKSRGIMLGVVAQSALIVVVLVYLWAPFQALLAVILVPVLGWTAEFIGSRTGVPFGRYHYTPALQPQIHRVPVAIPLAWLMMLPPSWAVAQAILPGDASWWLTATVAAAAFTAWDVYLDPQLVGWSFWKWETPGRYYMGIPLLNFFGWFVWAWVITALVRPESLAGSPLVLVYVLTWLFQFGGHLVFWNKPVSGIAGFFAMGAPSVAAIWTLFRGLF